MNILQLKKHIVQQKLLHFDSFVEENFEEIMIKQLNNLQLYFLSIIIKALTHWVYNFQEVNTK